MTCHTQKPIKIETNSPSTSPCCFSNPGGSSTYTVVCSEATSSTTSQSQSAGIDYGFPIKRIKLESEAEESLPQTPEMKKKLKTKVLQRRKDRGCPDVPSNLFEEPKKYALTEADKNRRARRQKQNREAAQRCRAKKKDIQDQIAKEVAKKKEEYERIKMERDSLILVLQEAAKKGEAYERVKMEIDFLIPEIQKVAERLEYHMSYGRCELARSKQEKDLQQVFRVRQSLLKLSKYHNNTPHKLLQLTDTTTDTQEIDIPASNSNNSSHGQQMMSNTDSNFNGIEPLNSWDISYITPDIPQNIELPLSQLTNDEDADSTTDMNKLLHLNTNVEETHANYNQNPSVPSYVRNLTNDFVSLDSVDVVQYFASQNSGSICFSNIVHGDDNIHSISACTDTQDIISYPCISPNLVQPVPSTYQSVILQPTTTGTLEDNNYIRNIVSRDTHFLANPGDLNNNTMRSTTPDKAGQVLSFHCTSNNMNTIGLINRSYTQQNVNPGRDLIFKYDCVESEHLVVADSEPISPFYTQGGGNKRL